LPINSNVNKQGDTFNITGGTPAGANLFHSFKGFSVPAGNTAFFDNNTAIQNIISRITGGSVSNINGLLKANGNANLFLINPNGIVFGQNAQLNIGGSFVATTASAISFGNQGFFSASNLESSPSLLTVNPTAFLFNQIQTASIQNNSVASSGLNSSSEFTATGLRVPDGKSLLLVGGDINMDGGSLYAFGGRVELGGLKGAGTIGLNLYGNNLSLNFPSSVERSDIFLSRGARVYVDAGDLTIKTNTLLIKDGAQVSVSTDGAGKGGNISVDAQDVQIIGSDDNGFSALFAHAQGRSTGDAGDLTIKTNTLLIKDGAWVNVNTYGAGNGGNISVDAQDVQIIDAGLSANAYGSGDAGGLTIKTNTLLIKDGAQVSVSTDGAGKGGNLTVDAQDVQVIGIDFDAWPSSGLSANAYGSGDAGDLTIKTNTLLIKDGARVDASTYGAGKGGNLTVDAQDVQIIGSSDVGFIITSGLFANAQGGSTGDAGDLTIKTNTLVIKDGGWVGAGTYGAGKGGNLTVDAQDVQIIGTSAKGQFSSGLFADAQTNNSWLADVQINLTGDGDAGDLTIKTNTLLIKDGARVDASTYGAGKGGNLTVDAQDVQIIGSGDVGFIITSGLFANAQGGSTGDAGDLTIKTNTLLIKDGAQMTVSNQGPGNAGKILAEVLDIRLDNQGKLTAESVSGKGGDIQLIAGKLLLMRRNSLISATSGVASNNGFDGNINVDTKFLVTVPLENSDIVATGFGRSPGSNIQINAEGIFGSQFRKQQTSESDIVATGRVTLNTPDIDPNNGLDDLPTIVVDPEVVQICDTPGYAQSSFIITGRGGLPSNPTKDVAAPDGVEVGWVSLKPRGDAKDGLRLRNSSSVITKPISNMPERIVEASGWSVNKKGEVVLTANVSNTRRSSWQNAIACNIPHAHK
jgi:filamentous hemagglutinin family protein